MVPFYFPPICMRKTLELRNFLLRKSSKFQHWAENFLIKNRVCVRLSIDQVRCDEGRLNSEGIPSLSIKSFPPKARFLGDSGAQQ